MNDNYHKKPKIASNRMSWYYMGDKNAWESLKSSKKMVGFSDTNQENHYENYKIFLGYYYLSLDDIKVIVIRR